MLARAIWNVIVVMPTVTFATATHWLKIKIPWMQVKQMSADLSAFLIRRKATNDAIQSDVGWLFPDVREARNKVSFRARTSLKLYGRLAITNHTTGAVCFVLYDWALNNLLCFFFSLPMNATHVNYLR